MKKLILTLLVILIGSFVCVQAQTYKLNKEKYDYKMYVPQQGDPHKPWLMGLSSAFLPGLGQMISGETGRGLAFLGGSTAAATVMFVGYGIAIKDVVANNDGSYPIEETNGTGWAIMLAGLGAMTAIDIWAIIDAVKVAKVNNMYFQDQNGNLRTISFELNPFVDAKNYLGQNNIAGGLSLRVTF